MTEINNEEDIKILDLRNIENEILNPTLEESESEHEEIEGEESEIDIKSEAKAMKMTKKEFVIHKLIEMSTIMGVEIESKRELGRIKVNILEGRLKRLTQRGTQRLVYKIDEPAITKEDEDKVIKTKAIKLNQQKSALSDDMAVEALVNFHLTCSDYLEVGSNAIQKVTDSPYVPKLQGLTRSMLDNEKSLRMCLKGLLASEHGEDIKNAINPVWLYFVFMGGLVSKTIVKNIKNDLEENSKNTASNTSATQQ